VIPGVVHVKTQLAREIVGEIIEKLGKHLGVVDAAAAAAATTTAVAAA
jgi:hypothetical protein